MVITLQLLATTPRDKADRYSVPDPEALVAEKGLTDRDDFSSCATQRRHSHVLALSDVKNNEPAAIQLSKIPRSALTCILQEHVIPLEQPERWENGRENPASEAGNWTAIQRAMRQRMLFSDAPDDLLEVVEGHNFFLDINHLCKFVANRRRAEIRSL